jgi:phospholipid/cholesterol/gamma-HCH transport system substrate-binding protein
MRISNELKAGILVIIAVAVGVFFFFKTVSLKKETYELKTSFTYAGNLKPDAIVKLSGVEVGRLKKMDFIYDPRTKVQCQLELDSGAKVRSDAIAYIDTAGFVGDAFIGITAGSSSDFLTKGENIKSEEPVQTRILMKKAEQIEDGLNQVLDQTKTLLTDNRESVDRIIANIETVTQNFEAFSEDIKKHPWKLLFKGEDD